jgi:hypothetical protein
MSDRNSETGLEYANTDPSLHYNGIEPRTSERWFPEFIECLQRGDYEGAEIVKNANVETHN